MKILKRLQALLGKHKQSFVEPKRTGQAPQTLPEPERKVAIGGREPGWLRVLPADDLISLIQAKKAVDQMANQSRLASTVFKRDLLPAIKNYAEFVQLMPASESHHHAHVGGLLSHTIEMVLSAMTMRNGHLFPQYAPAEEIDEQRDQWTYVVFYAALLHDIAKPMTDMRILWRGGNMQEPIRWKPIAGPLSEIGFGRSDMEYRVEFEPKSARDYQAHSRLAITLLGKIAPPSALTFLAQTPSAFDALTQYLSGNKVGLLSDVVKRADMLSTARALKEGSRARFTTASSTPLVELLMTAIKSMLQGTELPLNRSGAAGWVKDGAIWFVAKRIADQSRLWIKKNAPDESVPGDSKNDRLFDTWQEYGLIDLNPSTGKAIWSCTVIGTSPESDDTDAVQYKHELSLLKFPLHRIYDDASLYPSDFDGKIIVNPKRVTPSNSGESEADTVSENEHQTDASDELTQVLPFDAEDEVADASNNMNAATTTQSNSSSVPSSKPTSVPAAVTKGKSEPERNKKKAPVISEPKHTQSPKKNELLKSIDDAEKKKPASVNNQHTNKSGTNPAPVKEKLFPPLDDGFDYSPPAKLSSSDDFYLDDDEVAPVDKQSKNKLKSLQKATNTQPKPNAPSNSIPTPSHNPKHAPLPSPKKKPELDDDPSKFLNEALAGKQNEQGQPVATASQKGQKPAPVPAAPKPNYRSKTGSQTDKQPKSIPSEIAVAGKAAPTESKQAVSNQAGQKNNANLQGEGSKTGSQTVISKSTPPKAEGKDGASPPTEGRRLFGTASSFKPVVIEPVMPATTVQEPVLELSETVGNFISWLQRGLEDRSITYNTTGAEVHFVPQGIALVSPAIFRRYCDENLPPSNTDKQWQEVQKEIIKLGLHQTYPTTAGQKRANILRYSVTGKGEVVAELSAVVLKHPDRYVLPVPQINPVLTLSDLYVVGNN